MSLLENTWFRSRKETEEEKHAEVDKLQRIVDDTITVQQLQHKLNDNKIEASEKPDDQELENTTKLWYESDNGGIHNPEEAAAVEKKIKIETDTPELN